MFQFEAGFRRRLFTYVFCAVFVATCGGCTLRSNEPVAPETAAGERHPAAADPSPAHETAPTETKMTVTLKKKPKAKGAKTPKAILVDAPTTVTEKQTVTETVSVATATPAPTPVPTPAPAPIEAAPIALAAPIASKPETPTPAEDPHDLARPKPELSPAPTAPQKIGITLFAGVGINYVTYEENLSDVDTRYHDLRSPSTLIGTGFQITDASWVEASYKITPISFDNSSAGFSNVAANWKILSLHGATRSDSFSKKSKVAGQDYDSEFRYLYGFQYHELPLALFRDSDNQPLLKYIRLMNLSLGGSYVRYLNPWTRASILGHLQYPLGAQAADGGASLSVRPQLLFDGSVGIEKRLTNDFWLGLHWYGQFQRMNFDYSSSETTASGVHTTLFSNLELRFTFDF